MTFRIKMLLIGALSIPWVGAQELLTLDQAVEIALQHNKTLSASKERVEAARAALGEARTGFLPMVTGSADYTKLDVGPFMPGKIFAEFSGAPPETFPKRIPIGRDEMMGFNVQVQQPVFTGFSIVNGYRMAKSGLKAGEAEYSQTKSDLLYQVQEAYWGVVKAEKFWEVSIEAVQQVEGHVRDLENMYSVGMITKNDLLRSRVQLSNTRLMTIQAENALQLSNKALCSVLGVPLETRYSLTEKLEFNAVTAMTIDQASEQALKERPEIIAMEAGIDIQKRAVDLAAASLYPTVAVVADLGYRKPDREYNMDFYTTWTLSVVASMNLFDWGATHYRRIQANRQLNEMQQSYLGLQDGIRLEVTQAVLSLHEAEERIRIGGHNVEQAEENYRVTDDLFKQGMATNTEFLDANTLLTQAKNDYISALADYKLAEAKLKHAVGLLSKGE